MLASQKCQNQTQALSLLLSLSISFSLPPVPSSLPPFLWLCSVSVSMHEWHFSIEQRYLRPASPTFQAILMDNELWCTRVTFYAFLERCLVFHCILPEKILLFILKVLFACFIGSFFSSLKLLQFNFTI